MTPPLCTCPPEPPIDYGRGWRLDADSDAMICTRCGGAARPEHRQQLWRDLSVIDRWRRRARESEPLSVLHPEAGRR